MNRVVFSKARRELFQTYTESLAFIVYAQNHFPLNMLTLAFSIQGHMAQAALASTCVLGFFNNDHSNRTPSNLSITLKRNFTSEHNYMFAG